MEPGHIRLSRGPKENRSRPAINPLFRSAAQAYGPRVVGVILSGSLDDGTAGLWEIKHRGGVAIVQDPEEARHSGMPRNAMENVEIDYKLKLPEMANLLETLAGPRTAESGEKARIDMEQKNGRNFPLTCPECRGPIEEQFHGKIVELRCRVGHRYSAETFLAAHADTRERVLWTALLAIEEAAELADHLSGGLPVEEQARVEEDVAKNRALAVSLRELITHYL